MEWNDVKQQLLQDPELRKAYEKVDLQHSIGKMITDARIAKKMTQSKLAELVGTKQPSIARLEKGAYLPSLSFLQRIASAFQTQLLAPQFEFMEDRHSIVLNIIMPFQPHSGQHTNLTNQYERHATWSRKRPQTSNHSYNVKEHYYAAS
jgi:transcriptional regulator with XRE-family HTH domain